MTLFDGVLDRLGLAAYTARFRLEGFDTWPTLMDITEADLDALDVKLGHRRKLQRAISQARGDDPPPPQHDNVGIHHSSSSSTGSQKPEKRKYTRHPPPDLSAPKRPPPAYVTFSNDLRATKPKLEFGEFTKLVGKHWQTLDPVEKETREAAAQKLKDVYNKQLIEYKKTVSHAEHMEVLAEWKLKHKAGPPTKDSKRPRMEPSASGTTHTIIHEPAKDDECCASVDEYDQDEADSPSTSSIVPEVVSMPASAASRWRSAALQPSTYSPSSSGLPESRRVSAGQRSGSGYEESGTSVVPGSIFQGPNSHGVEGMSARPLHQQSVGCDDREARTNSPDGGDALNLSRVSSSSIPTDSTTNSDKASVVWSSNRTTLPLPDRTTAKKASERTLPSLANLVSPSVDDDDLWCSPSSRLSNYPSSAQQGHYLPSLSHNNAATSAASTSTSTAQDRAPSAAKMQELPPLYSLRDGSGRPTSKRLSPTRGPVTSQLSPDATSHHEQQHSNMRRDQASLATLLRASKQVDGDTRLPQHQNGSAE